MMSMQDLNKGQNVIWMAGLPKGTGYRMGTGFSDGILFAEGKACSSSRLWGPF